MNKNKHDDDVKDAEPAADALASYVTVTDGTRPVYIRRIAIDAFYALGEPPVSFRIVLRSGEALIVNWSEAAKTALLDAIG